MKKIAILFPGIGYTHDKPLMYYSRKIAMDKGYETICIEYSNLPENIKGNTEKMKQALLIGYNQSVEQLKNLDYSEYEEVLIVGKSLGTVIAAKYHEEYCKKSSLVLYTPVEATFRFDIKTAIAFIGDSDPWSNLNIVKELSSKSNVPLHIYNECNHSLEVIGDCAKNIEILKDVMNKTSEFVK